MISGNPGRCCRGQWFDASINGLDSDNGNQIINNGPLPTSTDIACDATPGHGH
jgi:hypothetical protein